MPVLVGIAGAGILGGGVMGYLGSKEQADAAEKGLDKATEIAGQQQALNQRAGENARYTMGAGGEAATNAVMEGLAGAGANIYDWGQQAKQEVGAAGEQARQDLIGGQAGAQQALSPLAGMLGYANQAGQTLGQLATADPRQNWQQDPGYEFRRQQGEQAIQRAASAQGGRLGGATLKALAQYNQDLASQEYGNAVSRGLQVGQQQMGAASGLAGLGGIGANAQGRLADIAMGGGRDLANVSQNIGQQQSGISMGLGTNLGNLAWQGGQGLGNLLWGQGQAIGNTYMGQQDLNNAVATGLMGQTQAATPYAGAGVNAIGNTLGTLGGAALYGVMSGGGGGGGGGAAKPETISM